jgi:uncharacterized protein
MARIEVPADELSQLCEPEIRRAVVDELTEAGFKFIALDLAGFRSGSLNRLIGPQEIVRYS